MHVSSFGRPEPEPELGPEQTPVTPSIAAVIVPVLSREALAAVADEIRMSITDAVLGGFLDGAEAFRSMSEETAASTATP